MLSKLISMLPFPYARARWKISVPRLPKDAVSWDGFHSSAPSLAYDFNQIILNIWTDSDFIESATRIASGPEHEDPLLSF